MAEQKKGLFRRFFGAIWNGINSFRRFVLNCLFLLLIVLVISSLFSSDESVKIAPSSALVLDLNGSLVEEKAYVNPVDAAMSESMGENTPQELLVSDVVKTIQAATNDSRIKALVLSLGSFQGGSLDKLSRVGDAIEAFKASGKRVFATGDSYSQSQYFLASYAQSINLTPMGSIILEGYGSYPMYYKSALEKLKVTTHVFRVGTYKSAVEPFLRDDMSEEAKEANREWLNELWSSYKEQVAARRGFAVDNFDETLSSLYQKLLAVQGDTAQYALDARLVDSIKTRHEFPQELIALVGQNDQKTFNQINYANYSKQVLPPKFDNPMMDKVAVVVARGIIVDGSAKAGMIGGDSTAALLRKARADDSVKAVVLRVDSGGGSAFASEVIAQEVKLLKAEGKPVIASMGAVAASGGYWISAPTNEIWAEPTTITGSIGIFGMFNTLENVMPVLGLNVDGVGTTELAGLAAGLPFFKGLTPEMTNLMQLLINKGYDEFISMVAENRGMTKEAVENVAQGRVWTGKKALELGLVDKLGGLKEAVTAAAEKAGLSVYDISVIEHELTPTEQMLKNLFDSETMQALAPSTSFGSGFAGLLQRYTAQIQKDAKELHQFNDPKGMYSLCLACNAVQ